MKKICSPLIVAFLLLSTAFAQESYNQKKCTTLFDEGFKPKVTERIPEEYRTADLIDQAIPLKFHVIRNGPVEFDDPSHVDGLITLMNETFLEANIQFEKCGEINYIEDSQFANDFDPTTIKNQLHDTHGQSNVINIYIANTTETFGGFSFGSALNETEHYIQDNAIVMSGSQYLDNDTFLLAHELGHYFGLFHPSVITFGVELVDGSNCESAGDFCCDTPASLDVLCCSFECEFGAFPEEVYDSQGDAYHPDVKNIMTTISFSLPCREYFTPEQYERMAYYHENFLLNMSCTSGLLLDELSATKLQIALEQDSKLKQLKISLDELPAHWTLKVYSISGALVFERENIDLQEYILDTNQMKAGVYVLLCEFENGQQQIKFLID